MKKGLLILATLLWMSAARSQVLLSLIFGDKLNSPKIEFGLEGGVNFCNITNLEQSKVMTGFNLGFYFDFRLKNLSWYINTGCIVKSPMGVDGLPVYSLEDEELDNVFDGGYVDRKIRYFNVPILIKYKFKNNIYIKGGPQLGLLFKAFDEFNKDVDGENVVYKNDIKDQLHVIDAGLALGVGYRLNTGNGINLGLQFYNGLVPVMKGDGPKQYNQSLYITAGIPIGKGKAAKRQAAETKKNDVNSTDK
jgi:hypothetical protein